MNVTAENLSFEFATSTDYDEIKELILSSFTTPIRVALNVTRDDMDTFIPQTIKKCLSTNLSIMVKNMEKKIIAVQLVSVHNRNDSESSHDDMVGKLLLKSTGWSIKNCHLMFSAVTFSLLDQFQGNLVNLYPDMLLMFL
jgi:hypothetical protein